MAIDFEPIDFEPASDGGNIDFQAIDFEPAAEQLPQASYSNEGYRKQDLASQIPGVQPRATYKEPTLEEKNIGIGEAGLSLASGIPVTLAAPVVGLTKAALGGRFSQKEAEKEAAAFAAKYSYQPRSEAGEAYLRKLQPVMDVGMAMGPGLHIPAISAMQGATALKARFGKAGREAREAGPRSFADNLDAMVAEAKGPGLGQMDLFPEAQGGMNVKPAEAGAGPLGPETRGALANKRQTNIDFTPVEDLQVTREGVALRPTDENALYARNQQMDAMQAQLERERMEAQPIQNMPPKPNEPLIVNSAGEVGTMDQVSHGQIPPESPEVLAMAKARQDAIIEQQRLAAESNKMQNMHQMEIDPTQHAGPGEIYGAQYGTHEGIGRVDENGMPIRADLSMEAQNLQNPLQRNLWGDELGPALDQPRSMTEALDTLQHGPFKGDARDAALAALGEPRAISNFRQRGVASEDLAKAAGVTLQRVGNAIKAFKDGREVGRLESNMTPEQNRGLGHDKEYPASIDIVKVDNSVKGSGVGRALYQAWNEDHNGNIAPSGKTTVDAWNQWRRNFPEKVEAFIDQEAQRIRDGAPQSQVLSNVTDKNIAQQIVQRTYEPGVDPFKSQRGHVRVPGSSKNAADQFNKMAVFRKNIGHLLADERTPQELLESIKGQKDIPYMTDLSFTKGGDYMTARTKNPLVKYGVDTLQDAARNIKGQQKKFVHDGYAAAARDLPKEDFVNSWQTILKAQQEGIRFSEDQLSRLGLSKQAKDFVNMHWATMDAFLPKINEALAAIGEKPVHAQTAYAASKLTGQFRQVMKKDGKVVGALGADTKADLAKQVAEFTKRFPDTEASPVQFMGAGRQRGMGDFMSTLNFLAKNDPEIAQFAERVKEQMDGDVLNYRGVKTHTMQKKNIVGLPGNRPWETPFKNAKDGIDAQITYLNKIVEMAEYAKADAKLKELIGPDTDIGMPNAQRYLRQYRDMHLGRNPTEVGKMVEQMFGALANVTGGRSTQLGNAIDVGRNLLNKKLLALNPGFLYGNVLQPIKAMPEMARYLTAHGAKGYMLEGHVANTFQYWGDHLLNKKVPPHMEGAFKFAEDSGMKVSDMLEHPNESRRGVKSWTESILQRPAEEIESQTRQMMFYTMVDILHEQGIKPKEGLYTAAEKLTNKAMGDYSMAEGPIAMQNLGPVGNLARNLSTYKFNELNRLMEFVRLAKNQKQFKPLLTAIGMQVAVGGLMGTVLYDEADQLVKKISEWMGKPTSLTQELLEKGNEKIVGPLTVNDLSFGIHNQANVDMSRRVGMGSIADYENPLNNLMPGVGAIGQAYESGKEFISDPNLATAKRAIIDILPGGSILEPQFFTKKQDNGNYLGIHKKTGQGTFERTPGEQLIRELGATSVRESSERTLEFERSRVNKIYDEKQKKILDRMAVDYQENGEINPKYIEQYRNAHGFEDSEKGLESKLTQMAMDQNTAAAVRNMIRDAQGKNTGRIIRRFVK